jgi:hypothetical protein
VYVTSELILKVFPNPSADAKKKKKKTIDFLMARFVQFSKLIRSRRLLARYASPDLLLV